MTQPSPAPDPDDVQRAPKPRRRLLKLLALLVSTAIALVLVEVVLANFAPVPGGQDGIGPGKWGSKVHARSAVPGLHYALRPSARYEFQPKDGGPLMVAANNAHGMRDDELELAKPPGTVRIAVLGDSTTYGYGVNQGEEYVSVLEELLDASDPGRDHETLNFGVAGYGPKREALVLEHKALAFEPDVVVVGYNLNDPDDEHVEDTLHRYYVPQPWWRHYHTTRLVMERRRQSRIQSLGDGDLLRYWHAKGEPGWQMVEDGFARIKELCDPLGIPVVVVIFTAGNPEATTEEYRYTDLHDQVAELARANGFGAIDMSPIYSAMTAKGIDTQFKHQHPTVPGHRAAAKAIHDYLRGAEGPLPVARKAGE